LYREKSGIHWDNENGAKIEGEAADKVWQAYISTKVHFLVQIFAEPLTTLSLRIEITSDEALPK
jgi:hypothetical protein